MRNYDYVPDRPALEHPDVAGETQAWCSKCERDVEDCVCEECPNCGRRLIDCNGNCIFDDLPNKGFGVPVCSSDTLESNTLGDRSRFNCEKCGSRFNEIDGKRYRDGDVAQWCPKCGASDDFITEKDDFCPACGVESGQHHQKGCREIGYTPSQPEPKTQLEGNVGAVRGVPADAEEGCCEWFDNLPKPPEPLPWLPPKKSTDRHPFE